MGINQKLKLPAEYKIDLYHFLFFLGYWTFHFVSTFPVITSFGTLHVRQCTYTLHSFTAQCYISSPDKPTRIIPTCFIRDADFPVYLVYLTLQSPISVTSKCKSIKVQEKLRFAETGFASLIFILLFQFLMLYRRQS